MEEYEGKFHQKFNDSLDEIIKTVNSRIATITDDSLKFIEDKMTEMNTKFAVADSDVEKLTKKISTYSMNIEKLDNDILSSARSLKSITTKVKDLLKTYKTKTTILDSTIDVVHEEMESASTDVMASFTTKANDLFTSHSSKITNIEKKIASVIFTKQSSDPQEALFNHIQDMDM